MKAKYNNLYKFLFLIFTMIGYSMTANAFPPFPLER